MLPDHSPYNSHFLFSCATWAGHHYDLSLSDIFIQRSGFSLNPLPEYWHRPQQDAVGMWCWLIIPQSVRGSKDPSTVLRHVAPGGKVVRQHWGQISMSTGLISPVLFSRTHSSLSLAGSTHCRSWSTGSIVWTKQELQSVEASQHKLGPGHTSFIHHSEPT